MRMEPVRRLPSLTALQTFVETVARGSLTAAAQVLCLTQSAVSRQIQQLEQHYGCQLLERTSRQLQLTDDGRRALECAQQVITRLLALEDQLMFSARPFRLQMHVSLATRWLLPRLGQLYAQHPHISLSVDTVTVDRVDASDGVDAWIIYRADLACSVSQPLLRERLVAVCAPQLLAEGVGLQSLEELKRFTLLHRSEDRRDWELWLNAHGGEVLGSYRHLAFNLDELALDAAARGIGVAMTDANLTHDAIEHGRLVPLFGEPYATGGGYCLYFRQEAGGHPAAEAVRAWLQAQAAALDPR